jgi:hypothetical protein
MLRGFMFILLALYMLLPPGICACRLDALIWAALTEDLQPDCSEDPYEHDHHCPGAKKLFVQSVGPSYEPSGLHLDALCCTLPDRPSDFVPVISFASPNDFLRPPLPVILCTLRI